MVDETEVQRDAVQVLGEPTDGQVPEWDAAQGEWVPATPAGGSVDTFKTIAVSGQSDVVADSSTDTLTLVAGSNVTITTDAATDSITIAATGSGGNAFGVIAVSGQANVEADAADDTLTLVAGSNVTITTNAATDTVTIAASTPAHASSHAEGGSDRITSLALANTGLTVRDTDDSHELTIAPGSNLTANRTLTVNTGDASRAVTITGTASIEGTNTGDQSTFKTIDVAGSDSIVAATAADTLTFVAGSNITITTDAPSNEVHIAATGGVSDGDKGDITVSASGATWTIDNDAVTNAKLANVATATIKGRSTAGTGDPEDLTGTQATALLDNFTSTTKGLVPLSGGGTTKSCWLTRRGRRSARRSCRTTRSPTPRCRTSGSPTAGAGNVEEIAHGGGPRADRRRRRIGATHDARTRGARHTRNSRDVADRQRRGHASQGREHRDRPTPRSRHRGERRPGGADRRRRRRVHGHWRDSAQRDQRRGHDRSRQQHRPDPDSGITLDHVRRLLLGVAAEPGLDARKQRHRHFGRQQFVRRRLDGEGARRRGGVDRHGRGDRAQLVLSVPEQPAARAGHGVRV
ncbi:MAG: hypothetical protein IPK26_26065 [Planctomycetes bacterium]|nr:hypothetical protein [Planctomycetota bacterium]